MCSSPSKHAREEANIWQWGDIPRFRWMPPPARPCSSEEEMLPTLRLVLVVVAMMNVEMSSVSPGWQRNVADGRCDVACCVQGVFDCSSNSRVGPGDTVSAQRMRHFRGFLFVDLEMDLSARSSLSALASIRAPPELFHGVGQTCLCYHCVQS